MYTQLIAEFFFFPVLILSTVCFSILSINTEPAHSQASTIEDNVNSVSSGLSAFALELLTVSIYFNFMNSFHTCRLYRDSFSSVCYIFCVFI